MTTGLRISDDVSPLPLDTVTTTMAVLAIKGAGKSYTGSVILEEMVDAGQRVVVVDPVGAYWGARVGADGSPGGGLPITILGGEHGDLPLDETMGDRLGELVAHGSFSVVLDLSLFETDASRVRFLLGFVRKLYFANRSPIHLLLDEADEYIPQVVSGDVAKLVGAFVRAVRQGRQRGIGVTLLTQRSASLNKNVLSQIETLIAMRTTSPHDIKAVRAWASGQGGSKKDREHVLESLPGLATGEGWIWSPSFLGLEHPVRIKIRRRRTFDSSATPKVGEVRRVPKGLRAVDLDELRAALADVGKPGRGAKAKPAAAPMLDTADYIGIHRAREQATSTAAAIAIAIAGLTAELERERGRRGALERENETLRADVDGLRGLARSLNDRSKEIVDIVDSAVNDGRGLVHEDHERVDAMTGSPRRYPAGPFDREHREYRHAGRTPEAPQSKRDADAEQLAYESRARQYRERGLVHNDASAIASGTADGPSVRLPVEPAGRTTGETPQLKRGARAMLEALVSLGPLTRMQVATLAGIKTRTGTFSDYLRSLRDAGLVVDEGETLRATARAGSIVPPTQEPMTHEQLRAMWDSKLKAGARRMLDLLIDAWPNGMTRADLAEKSGVKERTGTFSDYLRSLVDNGLATRKSGQLLASPSLFMLEERGR